MNDPAHTRHPPHGPRAGELRHRLLAAARVLRSAWKPLLLFAVFVALLVLAWARGWGDEIEAVRAFIERLGVWGALAFILIQILATVAMVPATIFTVAGGALFHPLLGILYVSIGATIGAAFTFLIARYAARDLVARWVAQRPMFRKLNELTDQHGAWVVATTRLVPIFPYNVINYAFGLTSVRFGTYVLWSWLGMLPNIAVYVLGIGAMVRFVMEREVPWYWLSVFAVLTGIFSLAAWLGRNQWKAALARRRAHRRSRRLGSGRAPG